ncbi:MAG: rod shape-determining protein RodA, partial [Actinomycetota bacterium]|nr:rod shape-determining protein RodA [Actinomycetota bacterium]
MATTRYSTGTGRAVRSVRGPLAAFRQLDLVLLASVLCLCAIGVLMVYSSTRQKQIAAGLDPRNYLKRQALFIVLGLLVMVITLLVDYRALRDIAPVLWVGLLVVLVAVLTPLGASTRGAHAWFPLGPFSVEPSEIAKIVVIIVAAAYLSVHRGQLDTPQIITTLGLAAVPMILIYLQPDLGTGMVFVAVLMGMLLVAGARPRHIAALTALGVVGLVLVFQLGILKSYQLDRLSAFLDPAGDTQRSAYNLRQSQIAIAAGGVTGKGVFQGTQTNLSFVPEQHTDFIFTAVGEELGFVGASTLLALFGLVLWRTWRAAGLAKDEFGTLLCVGVLAMLLFQIFENVGMTMGLTPITGIPLPFVSYGGSSMLACFAAVG